MEKSPNRKSIHPISLVAVLVLAAAIVGLGYLLIKLATTGEPKVEQTPVYNITLIPAPTETAVVLTPTPEDTSTPESPVLLPEGVIGMNAYVQVTGTEGLGLRMRAEPGTSAAINFLAADEEVFKVIGGPVTQDGYTWWQLEAPYDQTRVGWAADSFLAAITLTTPTP